MTEVINSRYEILDTIRRPFRLLMKVKDQNTGETLMLKQLICLQEADQQQIIKEVAILRQLDHRSIVKIIDSFAIDNSVNLYGITMELMGGNLQDHLDARRGETPPNNPSKVTFITWTVQFISGLAYCHSQSIVHRDIKPSNLLLGHDNITLKIADFGISDVSKQVVETRTTGMAGTELYMPPEAIDGSDFVFNFKSDVWGAGIVMHEMVSLVHPFEVKGRLQTMQNIFQGRRNSTGEDLEALIKTCLQVDPNARPDNAKSLLMHENIASLVVQFENEVDAHDLQFGLTHDKAELFGLKTKVQKLEEKSAELQNKTEDLHALNEAQKNLANTQHGDLEKRIKELSVASEKMKVESEINQEKAERLQELTNTQQADFEKRTKELSVAYDEMKLESERNHEKSVKLQEKTADLQALNEAQNNISNTQRGDLEKRINILMKVLDMYPSMEGHYNGDEKLVNRPYHKDGDIRQLLKSLSCGIRRFNVKLYYKDTFDIEECGWRLKHKYDQKDTRFSLWLRKIEGSLLKFEANGSYINTHDGTTKATFSNIESKPDGEVVIANVIQAFQVHVNCVRWNVTLTA